MGDVGKVLTGNRLDEDGVTTDSSVDVGEAIDDELVAVVVVEGISVCDVATLVDNADNRLDEDGVTTDDVSVVADVELEIAIVVVKAVGGGVAVVLVGDIPVGDVATVTDVEGIVVDVVGGVFVGVMLEFVEVVVVEVVETVEEVVNGVAVAILVLDMFVVGVVEVVVTVVLEVAELVVVCV